MISLDVGHPVLGFAANNYLLSVGQNIYFFNQMLGIKNIRNVSCDFLNLTMIYCSWIFLSDKQSRTQNIQNFNQIFILVSVKATRNLTQKLRIKTFRESVLKHHGTWAAGVCDACRGPRRAYAGSCIIRGHLDYQTTWTGQPLSNCTNSLVLYNPTKLLPVQTCRHCSCSVSLLSVCECKHT